METCRLCGSKGDGRGSASVLSTIHRGMSITPATAALCPHITDTPIVQSGYGHQRGFASVSVATVHLD